MKEGTLGFYLQKAGKEQWALPHFNVSDLTQWRGIMEAAKELQVPVMVGTAENERRFLGLRQAVALVKSFREEYDLPVFLNADHCKSVESALEAFAAGYDSIHIDLSGESLEKNTEGTKKVVEHVKSKNPDVQVEGELGYLVTESSTIHKGPIEIPEDSLTKVEEAVVFCKETGIDRFSPAVGTIHGVAEDGFFRERLILDLITSLRKEIPENTILVLHGGSGVGEEDMKNAIEEGISNIHISTELRIAFSNALRMSLIDTPEEIVPYRYFQKAMIAVKEAAIQRYQMFGVPKLHGVPKLSS